MYEALFPVSTVSLRSLSISQGSSRHDGTGDITTYQETVTLCLSNWDGTQGESQVLPCVLPQL